MRYDEQPTPRAVELPDGLTREELLGRVREARESTTRPLDLTGRGSSGVAVLSLAVHQRRLGLQLAHVTCIAARGEDDPVTGRPLATPAAPPPGTRVTLVPHDDRASREWSAATTAAFRAAGWEVG